MKILSTWFACIISGILAISCCSVAPNWQTLDLGSFKISIPENWKYIPEKGEDSFVGVIKTPKSFLSFDFSHMGYANHLIPTEDEYLAGGEWRGLKCYFCKVDVIYTANFDVEKTKREEMKKEGITDTALLKKKVEPFPDYETKTNIHKPTIAEQKKYPKADYIADLAYKGETVLVPIQLPEEIKNENIQIDSNSNYVFKTIWPKSPEKGITGIYIKSRNSNTNFNLAGDNLTTEEQKLALQVFKTIEFKK